MYANITNPANFQLQDFAQFGFRVITTDFIPVPGEQYRTLYVLQDAVVTATTQKGDDITSKAILAGTLLHGLFNSVSITSGRVLAYAAGRITADEIIALYESYVSALGGTLENTQCAIDTLNDTGVDFFADASLVMIPEGYATGVVYGQRPLTSDSQLTFTRASTATRVNSSGLIEEVASGVPRLDYSGGASCPRLLLEPQTTALNQFSEQIDNAWWSNTRVTISANSTATLDPSGYNGSDLMVQDAADTNGGVFFRLLTFAAVAHTWSVFAKMDEVRYINLGETASAGSLRRTWFDLQSGVVGTTNAAHTASIENYGNGWYRCSITFTATAGNYAIFTYLSDADNSTSAVVSKGSYFWGANLTATSYLQSYIPTTAAAVTRLADACSKTGIASLIGQTQGTLFVDFNWEQKDGVFFINSISDGTTSNELFMAFGSSGNNLIRFSMNAGGINYVNTDSGVISSGRHKIAFAYKTNDVTAYIDGVQIFTDTSAIVPATSAFKFARSNDTLNFVSSINQQLLFKTRLSNEQLQTLTSL
jgi:hypothetical protein